MASNTSYRLTKKERKEVIDKAQHAKRYDYSLLHVLTKIDDPDLSNPADFVKKARQNEGTIAQLQAQLQQYGSMVFRLGQQKQQIDFLQETVRQLLEQKQQVDHHDQIRDPFIEQERRKLTIRRKIAGVQDQDDDSDNACVLCTGSKKIIALLPCGHKQTCGRCTLQIIQEQNRCPIYNSPIMDAVRVFDE